MHKFDRLREVLANDPDDLATRVELGVLCQRHGRLDEALVEFRRVQCATPDDARSHYNVAAVLLERGAGCEALDVLQQAIERSPDNSMLHYGAACVLQRLHRTDDALLAFSRTLAIEPGHANAWYGLGTLFHGLNDPQRAQDCFDRVLALDADHAAARHLHDALAKIRSPAPPGDFVRDLFDSYAAHFDAHLVQGLSYRAPQRVAAAISEQLPTGSRLRVLDLGCGTGLSGLHLRSIASSLDGVDISPAMLARASQRGCYDHLDCAEIEAHLDALKAASLDLITAVDVFGYVGDIEQILKRSLAVLAPGGLLVFTVETMDGAGLSLAPTGRYRHSSAYLSGLRERCGYRQLLARRTVLRLENRQPCKGMIHIWQIQ